jgi:hypothetical protein
MHLLLCSRTLGPSDGLRAPVLLRTGSYFSGPVPKPNGIWHGKRLPARLRPVPFYFVCIGTRTVSQASHMELGCTAASVCTPLRSSARWCVFALEHLYPLACALALR